MKFNKKIAVALLEGIVKFPVGFLIEMQDDIPPNEFVDLFSEELCENHVFSNTLAHLYIMSNSGLIYPQFTLETFRELVQYQVDRRDQRWAQSDFWHHELPKRLSHHTLTVQGYEYLEKLQQEQS